MELPPGAEQLIDSYIHLLVQENRKFNLTGIASPEEIRERLFHETFGPLRAFFDDTPIKGKWIDVGSGAGFPGIPVALLYPECAVTLLESNGKKCAFLSQAVETLNLNRVTVIKERAETAGRIQSMRETFDFAVARAVAKLPVVLELASPFVKINGNLLLWLSSEDAERLRTSSKIQEMLNLEVRTTYSYPRNNTEGESFCVMLRKTGPTSARYPRQVGIPRKRPLSL